MKATGGRGVDVVLNSLSGELLHASWKCVAEFGRFVEIGRRDLIGQGRLAMQAFEGNRSFTGFDLLAISNQRPEMIHDLMTTAVKYYAEGHIEPIAPMHCYDATDLQEAFRTMQKATHFGKMVVTMPEDHSTLVAEAGSWNLQLRSDRAYLFVGGLGGIGKAMSTWLTEKGARHIIFLSRSAGEVPDDDPLVRELHAVGCVATRVSGSVSVYDDVLRAINSTDLPIGGIFQGSMILKVWFSLISC